MKVRGEEITLPTTLVGAYPRAIFLQGKVFDLTGVDAPDFPSFHMRELYRAAVALAIKDMTDAGLDIVGDGAQHYEMETDYEQAEIFHFFLDRLEGFVQHGDNIKVGAFDLPIYKPSCVGPIRWRRPIFKPLVEACVQQTNQPVKINAAVGPATMAALITDKHYGSLPALANDLARALNTEFKDMAARGVDQIQVAEVLTFFEPADWVTEAVNIAFQDVPCYRIVHICYGQQEGQPGVTELRGPKLFPWVWEFAADQIQYEMASHDFDDSDIRAIRTMPANKHFGVGVIKGKDLRVEAPEWIAAGIRKVLAVLPPENVCISTDCTLSGLHRIVAKRKLKALVEGTNLVRAEVGARLVTA